MVAAMNQHWEHIRYSQRETYWYSSIHSAVLSALVVLFQSGYIRDSDEIVLGIQLPPTAVLIAGLLTILSVIGIVTLLKSAIMIKYHQMKLKRISENLDLSYPRISYGTPLGLNTQMDPPIFIAISPWLLLLYVCYTSYFVSSILLVITESVPLSVAVFGAVFAVLFFSLFIYIRKYFRRLEEWVDGIQDHEQSDFQWVDGLQDHEQSDS